MDDDPCKYYSVDIYNPFRPFELMRINLFLFITPFATQSRQLSACDINNCSYFNINKRHIINIRHLLSRHVQGLQNIIISLAGKMGGGSGGLHGLGGDFGRSRDFYDSYDHGYDYPHSHGAAGGGGGGGGGTLYGNETFYIHDTVELEDYVSLCG